MLLMCPDRDSRQAVVDPKRKLGVELPTAAMHPDTGHCRSPRRPDCVDRRSAHRSCGDPAFSRPNESAFDSDTRCSIAWHTPRVGKTSAAQHHVSILQH
jgi:hypothetical protein